MRSVAVAGAVATLVLGAAVAAHASWSDSVTVAGQTWSTAVLPVPVTSCATVNLVVVSAATISWTAASSPAPLAYTATVLESGETLDVVSSGGQRSVQVTAGLLSTVFDADLTVRVRASLPGTSWVSDPADERVRVNLLGTSVACAG